MDLACLGASVFLYMCVLDIEIRVLHMKACVFQLTTALTPLSESFEQTGCAYLIENIVLGFLSGLTLSACYILVCVPWLASKSTCLLAHEL